MTELEGTRERIPIIDSDVHLSIEFTDPGVVAHLPERWKEYVASFGFPFVHLNGDRPRQKQFAARSDAVSPTGAKPGTDPDFVREQLLDAYDMSGALINDILGFTASGGRSYPDALGVAFASAVNNFRAEKWLACDERWYGSVTVAHEVPGAAVEEIRRCREMPGYGNRWAQVLLPPDNVRPAGHQAYWPVYEACEHYDIPVGFHVLANRRITGTGTPNFYFEEHIDYAAYSFPLVASMVYEGVFERFPKLKVALLEMSWSWAVPFAWRLDAAYDLLRAEVPHLNRRPSEYLADHFWFSTQPMEEPDNLRWFDDVYQLFEDTVGAKLMYSSDYPHWDFDPPGTLPASLPMATRRKILGETAHHLYNIPLLAGTGLPVELAAA